MRFLFSHAIVLLLLAGGPVFSAVPRDFAVDLRAAVSDTAPHIVLSWTQRVQSNITAQKIHRRLKGETTWVKLADLTTTQTSYTDSSALPGIEYEYWMERNLTGLTPNVAMGYLCAGVKVPEVHSRGKLLLLIDDTMLAALAPEIEQLKLDLAGDGWSVEQITAPRSGTAISTKALITTAYNADPSSLKAVYLLGHVPVPYSGNQAPDGHSDHIGAWPADGYYGEMNGTWTDSTVSNTSASRAQNDNIPGDGKFDQVSFPSLVELQVGRVDLHTLNRVPSSGVTETARLRRYLRKAHDYRHKLGAYAAIPRRTLIRDGFGHAFSSEPFAVTAWMGAFACVGQAPDAPIDEAPSGQWFSGSYAGGQDYLWGHGCGGGSYESAGSLGNTSDFGHKTSRVVFTSIFGSYHGDWDADNNLMRTAIAGNATGDSLGLACFWPGRPNWFPHHPGMGETMGYMAQASMNAGVTGGGSYVPGGSSFRGVHIGLMGDPALRMHVVEPVRRLAALNASGQVTLSWAASTESGLQGYHVYRADTAAGPFTKLTPIPLAGESYTDATVVAGNAYTYLVRTLKLEDVPGGSYYNLSTGSAIAVIANGAVTSAPLRPTELTLVSQTSSTNAQLAWQDNSTDETGFRVERKTNAGGTFAMAGTVAANTTGYTDPGPFTNGSVYYYRVVATGAAGDSIASNEVSFDAVAGFVEFTATKTKVNKTDGSVIVGVSRFGGGIGPVSVNYATANSSASAGVHYTAASGTLSWVDGEQGVKNFAVPIIGTALPQLPRQFKVNLSSPTGGSALAQWTSIAVQIEDPGAILDSPWTSAMIGSITDNSPAVSAEGVIGDSTMGGSGVTNGATSEAGRFIYQSRTGDGVLTMQVPTPTPAQSGARFAVMVRASTTNNAIMAASVAASSAANYGAKLAYRTSAGGAATVTPSADNNQDTPQWLRITRAGNTFSAESSTDGNTWTILGSSSLNSMPAAALWGIFHYSADWASSTTYLGDYQLATYQNISLGGLPVPATPAGFTVGTVTNTAVPLTWTAVSYAAGYRIERRGDDGTLDVIADITSGATSFNDATVKSDTAYEYRIRAYNGSGESAWSSPVLAITLAPDVTTMITTDAPGNADATIRADDPTANFGSTATLPVTDSDIGTGSLTPVTKAWLRFDLGSLPTLKTAKLNLGYMGEQNLQAAFDAGWYYWMQVRLLAESSDTWDESAIHWNNAPQNDTAGLGVTGASQQVGSYFHFDASTLPAVNSTVAISLTASSINSNRGANNLITLALVPAATQSGSMIWASREHGTLPPPTMEVTSAPIQPNRPGFLTVAPGSGNSIDLAWIDGSSDETSFQIERRAANGAWSLLQTVGANVTAFSDSTALAGVIYEYRVRAVAASGNSSWTVTASTQHTSAAIISGAIWSSNGVVFNRADAPASSGYVPTGFSYHSPALAWVTSQTLSTTIRSNFQGWLGAKITVGSTPIAIRELGRWVISGNSGTHTVKVVDATTNLDVPDASVSIATAGAPVGFAYAPLANPVMLAANASYYIVSQEVSGGDQWYEGNSTLTCNTSIAAVNQAVYSSNGTTFTTAYSANNSYIPVAFKYSFAPLPFVTGHSLSSLRNDITGWLGMEITVGTAPMMITDLGRWVVAGNSGAHTVKLVDAASGSDLASVSIATASAPAGQFKLAPLAAPVTLAANTVCYLLSQETAGGDQWYDFATPAPGTATAYQYWLLANGLPMDESAAGSATATPANDSLPNLIKYALGLNPSLSGNGGRLDCGTTTDGGIDYLTFIFTRPEPAPIGISYIVESSPDLSPANWTTAGLSEISSTLNGGQRTITIRDSTPMTGGNRRFMRLRVIRP